MPIPESGCWVWMGNTNGKYNWLAHGKVRVAGVYQYVHRFVYQLVHGPISANRHIHHECSVRLCCNPDHLTEVLPIHNHWLGRGVDTQYKKPEEYTVDPFELA